MQKHRASPLPGPRDKLQPQMLLRGQERLELRENPLEPALDFLRMKAKRSQEGAATAAAGNRLPTAMANCKGTFPG